MDFLSPRALLQLIWLVPVLLLLAWWAWRRRERRLLRLVAAADLRQQLSSTRSEQRRHWRHLLLLLAVALLFLAAARPTLGETVVERPILSRDILLLVDCSRSMLAADVPPNRLRHARLMAQRLVERFPGDRFGVIGFAGDATLLCPLTANHESLRLYLQQLDTDSVGLGGTNVARALEQAHEALRDGGGDHRAIVVISDGDSHDGDTQAALAILRADGVPVHVIGVGDPAASPALQLPDRSFVVDREGQRVRARLDEESLRAIATGGAGVYSRTDALAAGLDPIVDALNQLLPAEQRQQTLRVPIERYQVPLALALLLLLARLLIGERQAPRDLRPKIASLPLVAVLLAGLAAQPSRAQDDGLDRLDPPLAEPAATGLPGAPSPADDEKPSPEVQRLLDALDALGPEAPAGERAYRRYELAHQLQSEDKLAEARSQYEAILHQAGAPADAKGAAHQNLGVIAHRTAQAQARGQSLRDALTEIDRAGDHYRAAMRSRPDDAELARNYELYLRDRLQMQQQKRLQDQLRDLTEQAKQQGEQAAEQQQQAADQTAGNPQQSEQTQQQASQTTQAARDSTQQVQDLADTLGNRQLAERSAAAQHELQAAQAAQDRAAATPDPRQKAEEREAAAKHLQNAVEQLAATEKPSDADAQDGGQDEGSTSRDGDPQTADTGDRQDDAAEGDGSQIEVGDPGDPKQLRASQGEVSKQRAENALQAQRILNAMRGQERDLLKAMQEEEAQRLPPVEKDW